MYQDNRPLIIRLIIAVILVVSAIILGAISSSARTLSAAQQSLSIYPPMTNPAVMENWLPESSYIYTVARLHDYLATNGLLSSSMTAEDTVSPVSNSYDFVVTIQPPNRKLQVAVQVTNNDGIFSTSVGINQQLQRPRIPAASGAGAAGNPSYAGFDALASDGVGDLQANELAQAFYAFSPEADSISINTYSIRASQGVIGDNAVFTYTFSVGVSGRQYNATLRDYGFLQAQLILNDQKTGRQLFDSGIISQGS